jgi:outer membrane protein assembly factor BamB
LRRKNKIGPRPLGALAALLLVAGQLATAAPVSAQSLTFVKVWSQTVSDGSPISLSSPNVATLGGASAVVVGDQGGHVYGFSLATGAVVPGWPASTGGIPIGSTPSVAALRLGSPDDTVFVGAGSAGAPHEGGYEAFAPDGHELWYVAVHNPGASYKSGVVASLAVGDLQGSTDVVAPSVGQDQDAINAATGAVLPGFPWFQADGDYATPALADLYGTGKTEIVEGGGQTAGLAFGVHYPQGGHVRVLAPTGNSGAKTPAGGLMCDYHPLQSVDSSPAVGRFLARGAEGITVGTGNFWPGAPPGTDAVLAVDSHCHLVWSAKLDGLTTSSPALSDLLGNGTLQVVEGTNNQHGGGSVYALDGATGSVIWRQSALGEVIGSVVTANLGAGYQDVIVAGTGGALVLDGRTGRVIATLERGVGLQNSALVTDDPNGSIGITVAGYNAQDIGTVEHFQLPGSDGGNVDQAGAWPMFHHDPRLSGNAEAPI